MALEEEGIPLRLLAGAELFLSNKIFTAENLDDLTINDSRYMLCEMPLGPFRTDNVLMWFDELLDRGYTPILAHPERYFCVQDEPNLLHEWRMQGALAQMNKGSILGRFGWEIERTAEVLLRNHLFTCIASDAHHAYIRTTDMKELYYYLQRHYSLKEQDRLLRKNPLSILRGLKSPQL